MASRRIGKFSVSYDIINKHPNMVALMLAKLEFIPLRAELMGHSNEVDYIGVSPMFDEITDGIATPEYNIEAEWFNLHGDFTFEKMVEIGMSLEVSKK